MPSEKFQVDWSEKRGVAFIVAGSGSDDEVREGRKKSHIEQIADSLERYAIAYDLRVVSAHKQLEETAKLITGLNAYEGPLSVVSVAGGTDALSGTLSWGLDCLVIACPPDGSANTSPLHNPPGSSNATIYRPENVGRAVAQAYSHFRPDIREILHGERLLKRKELVNQNGALSSKYAGRQDGSE